MLAQPEPITPAIADQGGLYVDFHERLLDRLRWPLMIVLVGLYLAGYNTAWRFQPDSALYLDIGRNIAEGNGFASQGVANRLAYPGLPYLLAAVHRVAPGHVIAAANAVMLLIALTALAATYRLLCRAAGRPKAVLVVLVFAQSAVFMKMAFSILTDMPFLLGVQACLLGCECTGWLAEKPIGTDAPARTAVDRRAGWLLVVLGLMLAALMRPMMLPFIGALVAAATVHTMLRRQWRAALVGVLMVVAVGMAIYLLDPRRGGTGMDRYEEQVIQHVSNSGQWLRDVVKPNFQEFCHDTLPITFFGFSFTVVGDYIASGVLLGLCVWLFRVRPVWALWVLAATLTMVGVVPSGRYLLPLMPLLLLAWWNLARYANRRLGRRYGFLAAGLMITMVAPGMVRGWGSVWSEQIARPFVANYHHGKFQPLTDVAEVIARQTPPNALILYENANAGILSYLTRREVVEYRDGVAAAVAPRPVFVVVENAARLRRKMLRRHALRPAKRVWTSPTYPHRAAVPLTLYSTPWRPSVLNPAGAPVPAAQPTVQADDDDSSW